MEKINVLLVWGCFLFRIQKCCNSWWGWRRAFCKSKQLRNMSDHKDWIFKNTRIWKATNYPVIEAHTVLLAGLSLSRLFCSPQNSNQVLPSRCSSWICNSDGSLEKTLRCFSAGEKKDCLFLFNLIADLRQSYSSHFVYYWRGEMWSRTSRKQLGDAVTSLPSALESPLHSLRLTLNQIIALFSDGCFFLTALILLHSAVERAATVSLSPLLLLITGKVAGGVMTMWVNCFARVWQHEISIPSRLQEEELCVWVSLVFRFMTISIFCEHSSEMSPFYFQPLLHVAALFTSPKHPRNGISPAFTAVPSPHFPGKGTKALSPSLAANVNRCHRGVWEGSADEEQCPEQKQQLVATLQHA